MTSFRHRAASVMFCTTIVSWMFLYYISAPKLINLHNLLELINGNQVSCMLKSSKMKGKLFVNTTAPTWPELINCLDYIHTATNQPNNCSAPYKTAIIVPYRNRDEHLRIWLRHIHPFLKRQQLHYNIFVVEQIDEGAFNRGMLINVGFKESSKFGNFDCIIIHDVDYLPENDSIFYLCNASPTLISTAIQKWNYKLPFRHYFSGVVSILRQHFELVNGFSNDYFGWGAEDDDFLFRIKYNYLYVKRILRQNFTTLDHNDAIPNRNRYDILKSVRKRVDIDGLNSMNYTIQSLVNRPFYTHVYANLTKMKTWISNKEYIKINA